ncbi:hypothetical protein PRZ48_012102 [Zasmidium cellare]|uniref:MutL C-terminal dimerisation domain-containing protein n=1 Tax=Zasmidium cellare TaxID=395010 RepID=A0ABR0E4U7_ZASCE|nr:hypothetical protein PRZ48_012102 [Zasmidium cellare]
MLPPAIPAADDAQVVAFEELKAGHQKSSDEVQQSRLQSEKKATDATLNGPVFGEMASSNVQRILPLSAEAISQIHSSKHITSLAGVVLSLLENSLDASATKISISVDWRRGCCTVDDNGIGIPAAEFAENGGLGRMYCTSKRAPTGSQSNDVHGSNGMFIAELAAMSLLSITSTQAGESAAIAIHQGKVLTRRVSGQRPNDNTNSAGTNVVVKDLFGNMPVRVKHRALADDDAKGHDADWQELKRGLVGFLQAWTRPCSVRLQDANSESRAVNIAGQHHSVSTSLTEKSLSRLGGKGLASRYDLRDALPMLFQAGLAPSESRQRWIPVAASSGSISLKGLICLDPAPTKQCQLISMGIHPCNPTSGQTAFHDAVNKVFDNSSFGMTEESLQSAGSATPSKTRDSGTSRPHARKGIDRFAMYSLQVNIAGPKSKLAADLDRMSEASLAAIADVMIVAIHAWLEKNHFRPRNRGRRNKDQDEASTSDSPGPSQPGSSRGGFLPGTSTRSRKEPMGQSAAQSPKTRADVQSTSKRRKIVDLSLRPVSQHQAPSMQVEPPLALDHGTLSNIRRGTVRPRSDKTQYESAKATSTTSGLLRPEDVDAGALNGRPQTSPVEGSGTKSHLELRHEKREQVASSDDFGSIDDAELIAIENGRRDNSEPSEQEASHLLGTTSDANMTWTDPVTKQVFTVNARTGVVLPLSKDAPSDAGQKRPSNSRQRAGIDVTLSSAGRPLSLARRKAAMEKDESIVHCDTDEKWLPGFLREWDNPVFARQQEEPIPAASLHGPSLLELDEKGNHCAHDAHGRHAISQNALQHAGTKLSKTALGQAAVVGQVDRKFVLCKLPATEIDIKDRFVVIDQHAASERVVLEDLFADLCGPGSQIQSSSLEHETTKAKSLHFQVSPQEHDLFRQHRSHFATWGIKYTLSSVEGSGSIEASYVLKLSHLPTLIAARCVNLPSLAIDLLRSELWALAEGSKKPLMTLPTKTLRASDEDASASWLTLLPLMPAKLLEMLHSRACRSAIMFNDVLSKEECELLLEKLAKCVFPFVCAHGRVSMVPVLELGKEERLSGISPRSLTSGPTHQYANDALEREAPCNLAALQQWL